MASGQHLSSFIGAKLCTCITILCGTFQVDLRHFDEVEGSDLVQQGVDLSEFYMSVEWDILDVPAVR